MSRHNTAAPEASQIGTEGRSKVWCHLHLPKFKANNPECVSITAPGKTVRYAKLIELRDVKFVVQQGGRERSLREGRKNVHAYVVGVEIPAGTAEELFGASPEDWRQAKYNPVKGATFYDVATGDAIYKARAAYLLGSVVIYLPEA